MYSEALYFHPDPLYFLIYCFHSFSLIIFQGFTSLCERHTKLNLGVDVLTKTLNDYLGLIENAILKNGGDVVEFAGKSEITKEVVRWYSDIIFRRQLFRALYVK